VIAVEFSPDSKYLVTASQDSAARMWDAASGSELAIPHESPVIAADFSPDSKCLVTTSLDNIVRIWDAASGSELARMYHDGGVKDVAFSPDGKHLATASGDKTIRKWLWRSEGLIDEACRRLTRNLTKEEWKQSMGDEPYRRPVQTCRGQKNSFHLMTRLSKSLLSLLPGSICRGY